MRTSRSAGGSGWVDWVGWAARGVAPGCDGWAGGASWFDGFDGAAPLGGAALLGGEGFDDADCACSAAVVGDSPGRYPLGAWTALTTPVIRRYHSARLLGVMTSGTAAVKTINATQANMIF